MRITCPNCLAQYDIDDTLLPKDGREVQCSACDHVWFQTPMRKKADSPVPAGDLARPKSEPRSDEASDPATSAPTRKIISPIPPRHTEPATTDEDGQSGPQPKPSRKLDPAVADVLREEAAFEDEQRRKEAEGLHSQPELGLMGGAPWPAAKPPPSDPVDPDHDPADSSARTVHSFPDIEDVSATLEPVDTRRRQGSADSTQDFALPQTASARRRSFLTGFALPLIIAGVGLAAYLWAEDLSQLAPPLQEPLAAYVALVDHARAALLALIGGG
ncbi:MAG: zinc-ribbon domain-containing protein [Rhodobacteraceae bacterium]|nr:zinc-ribbon domain-containing protein [Paracoccaceae bacterium]